MHNCHPVQNPIDTKDKLSSFVGSSVTDPSIYWRLTRALQYATLICPEIAYYVQIFCLHMHDPKEPHFQLIRRFFVILRVLLIMVFS
jgi:hypothetical protein